MDKKIADAEETRRRKARELRYRKPIVRFLNIDTIRDELSEISENCDGVRYYFENDDDDTLISALDGDSDEEFEFKMMFADLCAECEKMWEDLANGYIPACFDDFFVAIGAGDSGGLLGWDSFEQDYFGLQCADSFAVQESAKRLKRLTKGQLIEAAHACFQVYHAYIGLRNRHDCLKAAMDILRDENTGYLQMVRQIEEVYERADKESEGFRYKHCKEVAELDRMLECMPQEAWLQ